MEPAVVPPRFPMDGDIMRSWMRSVIVAGVLTAGMLSMGQSAMASSGVGANSVAPPGGGSCTAVPKFTQKSGSFGSSVYSFAVTNNSCGDYARVRIQYDGTIAGPTHVEYSNTIRGNGTVSGDGYPAGSVRQSAQCQYNDGSSWKVTACG